MQQELKNSLVSDPVAKALSDLQAKSQDRNPAILENLHSLNKSKYSVVVSMTTCGCDID